MPDEIFFLSSKSPFWMRETEGGVALPVRLGSRVCEGVGPGEDVPVGLGLGVGVGEGGDETPAAISRAIL